MANASGNRGNRKKTLVLRWLASVDVVDGDQEPPEQNDGGVDSWSDGYASFEGESAERSYTGMTVSEAEDGENDENEDENEDECEREDYPPPKRRKRLYIPSSIVNLASSECWLCGLAGKHVAHVIGTADKHLFNDYRRRGFFRMPGLHSIENIMYLCAACYSGFSERPPVWAFLPADLDSFIAAEKQFQHQRQEAANAGQLLPRTVPRGIPSIPYHRYQIREGYLPPATFSDAPVRDWVGSPIAAIIRSASIVWGLQRLDPVKKYGVPSDVAIKFQHLLFLYGTPPPEVMTVLPRSTLRVTTGDVGAKASSSRPGSTADGHDATKDLHVKTEDSPV